MADADVTHPLMAGITIPPKLVRGPNNPDAVDLWIDVVEVLIGRGARTPSRIARLLGTNTTIAKRWIAVVKAKWAKGLSDDRINWRREKLYYEADEVAQAAWDDALTTIDPTVKAAMLRIVLEANKRKASLCGLDKMEVKIKGELKVASKVDLVATVEARHGLAPGALATIGQSAAMLISGQSLPAQELLEGGDKGTFDEAVAKAVSGAASDDGAEPVHSGRVVNPVVSVRAPPPDLFAGMAVAKAVSPGDVWLPVEGDGAELVHNADVEAAVGDDVEECAT